MFAQLGAAAVAAPRGRGFQHHVMFWLKEPASPAARAEFLAALKKMKAIEVIRSARIGEPAGTPRDVVDNTYTFDWLVTFDDQAAWQVYNDHALHDEFRKKAALWTRVLIYDSVVVD